MRISKNFLRKTAPLLLTLLVGTIFLITANIARAAIKSPNATTSNNSAMKNTPLIPRKIIFGNPERAAASLSPDGTKLAFLAPVNGVLNVWVASIKTATNQPSAINLAGSHPVTKEKKRSLRGYSWSYNNDYILYSQDQNGDENFHLYRVALKSGKIQDLTPYNKVRAQIIAASPNFPDELLIGLNKENSAWHDVYHLNITNGKLALVEKNRQFTDFLADQNLQLRIAEKATPENSPEFYIKDANGKWQFYEHVPFEDALSTGFTGFNKEGNIAYKTDSQGRDKTAIYAVDLNKKSKQLLATSDKADCSGLLMHPTELVPQAALYEYTKIEQQILDPRIKKDFAYLQNAQAGEFAVASRTLADDKWIIQYYSDTKPSSFYLYERDPKTGTPQHLTFLFTTLPALEKQPLAAMRPLVLKARDGLELISYLTLPTYAKTDTNNVPQQPLPLVLLVHGGPWARDSWGLDRTTQWLANRGYAVLSVNYRGSTGFGKAFINAGNNEWAGKMHDDLIDAVNWAIKNKIADPNKIAIMGGSYGGYATLVGLTFTPDLFCCGVSIVGPSNLITLINSVPPYWRPDIALFKKRVGDIDTISGKKMLRERSPLTYVDRIKKPLLILQGEHDPRVKKTEAEQIVNKMKEKGIPVTYVLYHDEGHGFLREPNRLSSNAITEQFLAENLHGRAEPVKDDFAGANFSIKEGKEYIAGLNVSSRYFQVEKNNTKN